MIDVTIVTGVNHKYFNYLEKMLKSLDNYNVKRIIIYDLGIEKIDTDNLRKNIKNYKNNILIQTFNFDRYPEHVDLNKYYGDLCTYAWKPIIISEVCERFKGIVFWFDSLTLFNKDIYKLFNILKNQTPVYTPKSGGDIKRWLYPTTLKYIYGEKYINKISRAGGCFGVNYDTEVGQLLVSEWKKYSLIKECIAPEGSNRSNHRQDQTILSIIFYHLSERFKFKHFDRYIGYSIHNY